MKAKTWIKSRIINWKEEYLPPLVMTVVAAIIYVILVLTKVNWASPDQIFFYVAIIWIPALFYTLFYLRLPPVLKVIAYVFVTCSNLLATALNVYAFIPFFDTILHTLFGYVGGYIGLYVLVLKKDYDKMSLFTRVFFCFALVGAVGVLWEVCEYTVDVVFNGNTQHAVEMGIRDTMQDQFCNLVGGLVFVMHYLVDLLFLKGRYMEKMASLLSVHNGEKPLYKRTDEVSENVEE